MKSLPERYGSTVGEILSDFMYQPRKFKSVSSDRGTKFSGTIIKELCKVLPLTQKVCYRQTLELLQVQFQTTAKKRICNKASHTNFSVSQYIKKVMFTLFFSLLNVQ